MLKRNWEPMKYKSYVVTVKHDNGLSKIGTCSTSKDRAIELVMKAEGCPKRAIVKVDIV